MDSTFSSESQITSEQVQANTVLVADEGIDLLDILILLGRSKRQIAIVTALFMMIGMVDALIQKPVFTATAVIMTPQEGQSAASSLIGQLGALGSIGASSGLGLKSPADMYVGILGSRMIADDLIERFHLDSVYHVKFRTDAEGVLRKNTEFEAAKDSLIYIRVKDYNAKMAADIANAYVDELHNTNTRLAIGQAAQRRLFYDQQLNDEKTALTSAEENLKETEEKTGLIQLSGQAEMTIRNIAAMRAEISSKEVELQVTRTSSTDENPDVVRLQQEIASLKVQLATLENSQQHQIEGDVEVPAGKMPSVGLEYTRKLREVKYHEALYELLAKQAAAASLDEAKSAPLIQVVDPAIVPERKSGPSRVLITIGFTFAGLLLSAMWAIVADSVNGMKSRPDQAARLRALYDAMGLHRQSK